MAVKLAVRHPSSEAGQTGELSFELDQVRIVIGRGPGADVRLPDLSVSDPHALLEHVGSAYTLRDEGSTNGTLVNGLALVPQRPRTLSDGDEITIGAFTLIFHAGPLLGQAASPERTASLARRMLRELLGREHASAAPPYLRVDDGPDKGTLINLEEPPSKLTIGRDEEANLTLRDADVSRLHVELTRDADGTTARDLASKNGLEVNGKRLRERRLRHGDVLRLGGTVIVYQDPADEGLRQLEGKRDVTITLTRPSAPATLEAKPSEPEAKPVAPIETLPPTSDGSGSDMVVYALAFSVLLASLLGLAWLFHS